MKFGRKARGHDPRIPRYSMVMELSGESPPPASVDYTTALPASLGMFANDRLGDCTCAAVYHALQVWTANANPPIDTEPDGNAVMLYQAACGYDPANANTDQGGVEQDVLNYLLNTGAVVGAGVNKLAAYVEINPSHTDNIKRGIAECGVVYIGINVPAYLTANGPPDVWDVLTTGGDTSIEGGHAIILCGYDANGLKLISWGRVYTMTWAFFAKYCDEAYALVDRDWIEATGNTPAGQTLAVLEAQMEALKDAQ